VIITTRIDPIRRGRGSDRCVLSRRAVTPAQPTATVGATISNSFQLSSRLPPKRESTNGYRIATAAPSTAAKSEASRMEVAGWLGVADLRADGRLSDMGMPPNESRLSCGALKKDSFHSLRAPTASSAG